ncbi:hypothetical protein BDE02_12G080400 [Populus trichocarpa]|nr:hypothetical protein BDE02_12G080400 [Populus trichocarpa]
MKSAIRVIASVLLVLRLKYIFRALLASWFGRGDVIRTLSVVIAPRFNFKRSVILDTAVIPCYSVYTCSCYK